MGGTSRVRVLLGKQVKETKAQKGKDVSKTNQRESEASLNFLFRMGGGRGGELWVGSPCQQVAQFAVNFPHCLSESFTVPPWTRSRNFWAPEIHRLQLSGQQLMTLMSLGRARDLTLLPVLSLLL